MVGKQHYHDWWACTHLLPITRLIGLQALYKLHMKYLPLLKIKLKRALLYTSLSISFSLMYFPLTFKLYTYHNIAGQQLILLLHSNTIFRGVYTLIYIYIYIYIYILRAI